MCKINVWLVIIVVTLLGLSSSFAFSATYYVDGTTGNDGFSGAVSSPKKSINAGVQLLASGDTLIIKDGVYSGSSNWIGDKAGNSRYPASGSAGKFTTIKAENIGQVIIDGGYTAAPFGIGDVGGVNYLHIDGIHFRRGSYGVFYLNGNYNKITNCGFEDGGSSSLEAEYPIAWLAGSSYSLVEDCWVWGKGRYGFYTSSSGGGTNHIILRRVVVRIDDTPGAVQTAGMRFYGGNTNSMQNCIVLDSNIRSTALEAAAFISGGGSSSSEPNHSYNGIIALNNPGMRGYVPEDIAGTHTVANGLLWGNSDGTFSVSAYVSGATLNMSNLTIGANKGIGLRHNGSYGFSANLTNSLLSIPTGGTGFQSPSSLTNSRYLLASGASAGDASGATSIALTTLNEGLKYLPRVEKGSALATAGVGANILYQVGTTGTIYGEAGWNTNTTNQLWPYPNEQLWANKMRAYTATGVGGNRGFAALAATSTTPLTDYIWGYLGNAKPDIYGSGTADTTPPTSSITAPANNEIVSGTVSVTANASDNVGVSKIEFYVNGSLALADTATPYVFSWNTDLLAAGTYTLQVKAYDAAGNVAQSGTVSVSVVKDVTIPSVSLSAPVNNASVSGTVAVNATAADNLGVSRVDFHVNGALRFSSNVSPYKYNWNTATDTNGSCALTAKAYDAVGNMGQSSTVTVTVNNPLPDTTLPTVAISSPASASTLSGTVTVAATAADNVGVSRVEFFVNGVLQSTDTSSPYSFSWNSAAVVNGAYTLTAKSYDAVGNIGQSSTVTVTVNNQIIPAGSIWPDTTVPGVVDAGPDSAVELGVKFRSDITGYITGIRFYKASTNTGTHIGNLWDNTGKLLATATFANETVSGWQVVKFSAPVAITANTVYVASYHTNTGHYSDNQNYFSGKGMDSPPLHALADGVAGYSGVYAYGSTSNFPTQGWNSSNYWVDVTFTSNQPTDSTIPTVAISSPSASASVSGNVTVSATAGDNVGVARVEFFANGSLKATDASAPYSFIWNTALLSNGSYIITAKAYDAAGNVGQSSAVTVTVNNPVADITAPTVAIISPLNNAIFSGSVAAVQVSATDSVGVSKVEFYVNSILKATDTASPYTFTWNTATLTNGSYTLTAQAYDAAGNVGQSSSTVTVNNPVADITAPTVSISSPVNNASVSGTAVISAAASDNAAVTKVEFYINGVLNSSDTASPYNFSWNTANVVNGVYSLTAKAYDAAGNTSTSSAVTLTVSNAVATPATSSIWSAATIPTVMDSGPDSAVELGVKFKSDVKGYITGIRFYKAAANTGTHIANLWTSAGKRLATATFTNETASGWQQVNFATPIAIAANTVYVASYHTNVGHYSADQKYFASKGVDSVPLHAPANLTTSPNGVFAYGSASAFPKQGWNSSNYWVDVVFKP